MSLPLRCKTDSRWPVVGITTLILLLFWAPVFYFAFKSDDGDVYRKCVLKICMMHVLVPSFVLAFQSSRSIWIVWISGLAIAVPRLLWSLSTNPSVVTFLQTIGSIPRVSGFTDISEPRSRTAVIILQFTIESIWMYSYILLGFVANSLVAHCGFDFVLVGALGGFFVGVLETAISHGDFITWFLYFASTIVFTVTAGIVTGALFALTSAKILGPGFYFSVAIVPWISLLLALMLRYMIGFWGTVTVPFFSAGYLVAVLLPMYRVRDE